MGFNVILTPPGFISSLDNKRLNINATPVVGDPLSKALTKGNRLGLLGIELETRRRNRLSGQISQVSDKGIELTVNQTFGNCPQYIQTRKLHTIDPQSMPSIENHGLTQLDQQAIELINNCDTFFVASYVNNGSNIASDGVDVSHRGGKPGFIRIDDTHSLTIPDYLGNFHFNTLGNFLENPKAGLLFIDFSHGSMLTLTGTVEILWDSPDTEFFSGAERLWTFRIDHGYWLKNVLPLRWKLEEISPNTTLTGSWPEAEATKMANQERNNWQPYQIVGIVEESSVIKSFYFQPLEGVKPTFLAGQFLTIKADIEGSKQQRTYTVSSAPSDEHYRISVKLERARDADQQDGVFSSFLHSKVKVGDIFQVKAPSGIFSLETEVIRPILLISAGVGITPMISMARHALSEGIRTRSICPIIFISSAHDATQRAFFTELKELAQSSADSIKVYWALSQIDVDLQVDLDFHHHGRISKQLLQRLLPIDDYEVYLCGPTGFMQDMYDILRELGVTDSKINYESFGPSTIQREDDITSLIKPALSIAEEAIVNFSKSEVEQAWTQDDGTLLEFAENHGLEPAFGCRNGKCGACKVKLLSGKVVYQKEISATVGDDEILLCSSVPAAEDGEEICRLEIEL